MALLQPGRLKNTQAIGWYLAEANLAQVSINITDTSTSPMHVVYEECVKDAKVIYSLVVSFFWEKGKQWQINLQSNCW